MKVSWKESCKFLSGAFFVSSGVLGYLYFAGVSVPLLGTGFIETPELSGQRAIVHAAFFFATFYIGYLRKPAVSRD
jgi:hypothetical protein